MVEKRLKAQRPVKAVISAGEYRNIQKQAHTYSAAKREASQHKREAARPDTNTHRHTREASKCSCERQTQTLAGFRISMSLAFVMTMHEACLCKTGDVHQEAASKGTPSSCSTSKCNSLKASVKCENRAVMTVFKGLGCVKAICYV